MLLNGLSFHTHKF